MTRTMQAASLVLDRATVAKLYAVTPVTQRRRRVTPVTEDMLDLFPAKLATAVRRAVSRGGVACFLVDHPTGLSVEIRNKRRRA